MTLWSDYKSCQTFASSGTQRFQPLNHFSNLKGRSVEVSIEKRLADIFVIFKMGAQVSGLRRLPGPRSRYYPEAARYMNLHEALWRLPTASQLELLRRLGASDTPNWATVDVVVEVFYLLTVEDIDDDRRNIGLSQVLMNRSYPFCQLMILYFLEKRLTKERWSEKVISLARAGNPYAQILARHLENASQERERYPYDGIAAVMDWNDNDVVQKVGDHFVDLSDTDCEGTVRDLIINPSDYICVKRIAAGTYGDVNHVIHRQTLRNYVMKLYCGLQGADRYAHDFNGLAALNHPCVIKLKGFALPTNNKPGVLLLPYYYEGSMADKQCRIFDMLDIEKTFIGIVIGMQYLHASGIIHGDLRPENILYDVTGYPVISGLVNRALLEAGEAANQRLPRYQAPEMYRSGIITGRVDVFSFCAIMYELITREKVFPERSREAIRAHCERGDRPRLRDSRNFEKYHPVVIDIIQKGLSVNPDERYSFQEIRRRLEQINFTIRTDRPTSDHILALVQSDGKVRPSTGCLLL